MTATPGWSLFCDEANDTESFVISAATMSKCCSLANAIASGVCPNCFSPTLFSAPREVFTTFCVSIGEGVYQVNRTCHPRASAVRIMFPTL